MLQRGIGIMGLTRLLSLTHLLCSLLVGACIIIALLGTTADDVCFLDWQFTGVLEGMRDVAYPPTHTHTDSPKRERESDGQADRQIAR